MIIEKKDLTVVLNLLREKSPRTFDQILESTGTPFHRSLIGGILGILEATGKVIHGTDGLFHLCLEEAHFSCLYCNKEPKEGDVKGFMICSSCGREVMGEYPGMKDSGHGLAKGQDVLVRMTVKGILPNLLVVLEPYDQTPAFPVLRVHRNMVCANAPLEAKQFLSRIRARGWRVVACQDIDNRDPIAPKDMGVRWVFGHWNGTVVMGKGPTDLDALRQVNAKIDLFEREESKCKEEETV